MLPQIILFGDSLTEWSFDKDTRGFGWVLENKYKGKAEIVNEGAAGYTSSRLKPAFERIIDTAAIPGAPEVLLFTIFLGANDACFAFGTTPIVPIDQYETNLRHFIEVILIEDNLENTKIVMVTPPPINVPDPTPDKEAVAVTTSEDVSHEEAIANEKRAREDSLADEKKGIGYRTYMNKKRYADKVMEIAEFYKSTGRVVGLDYFKALINAGLKDQGRDGEIVEEKYDVNKLPGCGLSSTMAFREGYFTDGLHLDGLGYDILSEELMDLVLKKWPELSPDKLEF
ncbi:SGNH hydrolase [Delitschia confertaspora ATCC 74209]|uniref:SGNH hydrolase n=1 Tax=Delitschia confertaspora ATCC 74209 TaxID=1513339 RepID=A0A9P4JLD9_9PLEO|nr:SGNH hydrolase [Delitschia confertaspora ATCC 74209]